MLVPSNNMMFLFVTGYLQQEKLLATCRAFILESSDLKEYAEHCTVEGFVPACLLSLFGKNLTTILNEYIALKTKETANDVPAMMSSLWKKLDYTLSQIKSIFVYFHIELLFSSGRTRCGIVEMKKQRLLQQSAPPNPGLVSTAQTGQLSIPVSAIQLTLQPTASPSISQTRATPLFASQSQLQESQINSKFNLLQILYFFCNGLYNFPKIFSESLKRRGVVSCGPHSTNKGFQDSSVGVTEEESEPMEEENEPIQELIDGNFPQMVIENAREKILSNKSLQEKLAENINKFLGSDGNFAQAPKQTENGPTVQESSIDEFLGLQGEIHMSEEAIQEILEQTESDPAFQALFDLFDHGKSKASKSTSHGVFIQNGGVENKTLADEDNLDLIESESPKLRPLTDTLVTVTGKPETAFKSVPLVTESNKGQSSDAESSEHSVESCRAQESAELVAENVTAMKMEKDQLGHNAPNMPGLQYDHSVITQNSLALLDDTVTDENRTDPETYEHHTSTETSLSEKTSAKKLSHRNSGHNVTLKRMSKSKSSHFTDSSKNQEDIIEDSPVLPVTLEGNCKSHVSSDCQDPDKLESESVRKSVVNVPDQNETVLQLESVDISNKPHSDGKQTLNDPCSKELHLRLGLENSETPQVEMQEPFSSSTKADGDIIFLPYDDEDRHRETSSVSTESNLITSAAYHSPTPPETACTERESSTGSKIISGESSSSQPVDVDPSNIVSLKIIISDEPFISSDAELNSAVSSITGESLPTIILSSPAKSPAKNTGQSKCASSEETEKSGDSALVEQNLLVLRPQDSVVSTINVQNEECTVVSVAGATNLSKDAGFVQLMPATSTAFGNSNSLFIATCVTDPATLSTTATPSSLIMLSGNSTPFAAQTTSQQLHTPPRTNNMFTVNQAVSPNFSQGSAVIIASPVQPVMQGMVGMIPVSVVGQGGNTFSAPSRQVLHMPVATSVCNTSVPKLPLPPKSQKIPGARNKPNAGKLVTGAAEPASRPSSRVQRTGNSDRNISADVGKKLEANSLSVPVETTNLNLKQTESNRRVLCFDSTNKGPPQKEKNETPLFAVDSLNVSSPPVKTQPPKRERERTLPRILCRPEIVRNVAGKETQPEKRGSAAGLDTFHKTTANKENEIRRGVDEKQKNQEAAKLSNGQQNVGLWNEKTVSSVQELNKKHGSQPNVNSKNSGSMFPSSKEPKKDQTKSSNPAHCLTSPLTKQAVEMLHDIQLQSPANKMVENGDLPIPRTPSGYGDKQAEDTLDSVKTPTCRRYNEDSTTPRIMVPPATPDLPACSPASETGSENSVSMAAHTLMILSRAAIARTSTTTPLKDNTQQFRSLRSMGKKRKSEDLDECERNSRSANKKHLQNSTILVKKKKIKQKKKLPISFPAEMDVDKFLLSLHYDE
uniref:Nuclear protein, coactivator of histone transcription n=1 Tax=Sphenodon punctatus TaxID=8508 RepID=A0A8D0LBZ5_SPHPU